MSMVLPGMHGLILTLILLSVTSAAIFKFVPVPKNYKPRANPISYFVLFFMTIAVAFGIFTVSSFMPSWVTTLLTHVLYVLSLYFLIYGLRLRQSEYQQRRFPWHAIMANMGFIIIVNMGIFYFYAPSVLTRSLLLNANLILLTLYAIRCIHKPHITFERGENVLRFIMYVCVGITCISPLMLVISHSMKSYMSYSVMIQSVQMHIVFGGLCLLILSDVIDLHYKNSVTDAMTGIYNRRYFIQKSDTILSTHQHLTTPCALIICDLDNFKYINDTYGHETGDKVIIQFGLLLKKVIREQDILARIGGEEFAIFLPSTSLRAAETIAERMRRYVETMTLTSRIHGKIQYTASFGVASQVGIDKVSTLMRLSDSALYHAKHAGRNQVSTFKSMRETNDPPPPHPQVTQRHEATVSMHH